jgi:hypothetical protein
MSEQTVQRAVRELVEAGLVSVVYERRRGNIYTFDNENLVDRTLAWIEWELDRRKPGCGERASPALEATVRRAFGARPKEPDGGQN